MTISKEGGRLRLARFRLKAVLVGAVAASSVASASDADLQRALLDSACAAPRIETLMQQGDLVAYRSNCLGTSHKIITIVCGKGRCSPSPSMGNRDRP